MFHLFTPSKPQSAHAPSQSSPYLSGPFQSTFHIHNEDHRPSRQPTEPQPPALNRPPPYICPIKSDLPPLVTQHFPHSRPTRSTTKLSNWFTGESDPITFALVPSPTREKLDPVDSMIDSLSDDTSTAPEKKATAPKPPITSRFSLFGLKPPAPKAPVSSSYVHDEWYDLDVKNALLPSNPTEPFSPSTFKNLQQNAERLLSKLQIAYKQRSQALHDVIAEKEAQTEEREGAEMRSRHLKIQLDDMTAKLAEQDKAMMDLVDQLAQEKSARRQVEDNARKDQQTYHTSVRHSPGSSRSRISTASDMSIESEDSCAESLFSRHGAASPTASMSSVSTMNSPVSELPTSTDRRQITQGSSQESRCQPAEKKLSDQSINSPPFQSSRCINCTGIKESEAWNLVNTMKLENNVLKRRLGQLEGTVDDCLDMVKGLF
ncbi:MAG: hypothetical protein Q9209_003081 [Squamulea sp. 1 TL-2023]